MTPLRVLHVDSGREYRGGQNQVRLLARELAREAGVEQRVVTKGRSELARRVASDGVVVREVPWGPSLDPRALWQLYREVTDFEPNLLHAHDSHALQLAYWGRRLAGSRKPVLVATRRVDFHVRRRSVWFQVDCAIAISEAVKAILVEDGMPAADVARKIVVALRKNRTETVVGRDARWMLRMNRFFPRLLDWLIGRRIRRLYAS